eukprot:gnl/Spiro4/9414_TR4975_c0_g1_i1.p1 gnl/Spiro4/9414_TR4975_c0_g1~~gnl/Spiro4/9414_TR4975_c0_g1_i1.p1  ORF type:complete len:615 (+),score=221.00 gnl/Spiro4/9414_TR4975_c0_g1_i1:66-1910(+)
MSAADADALSRKRKKRKLHTPDSESKHPRLEPKPERAPEEAAQTSTSKPQLYVPPHLRSGGGAVKVGSKRQPGDRGACPAPAVLSAKSRALYGQDEQTLAAARVKKLPEYDESNAAVANRVRAVLNRASLANLVPTIRTIHELYQSSGRAVVQRLVWDAIAAVLGDDRGGKLAPDFCFVFSVVAAILHTTSSTMGGDAGALYLERAAQAFDVAWNTEGEVAAHNLLLFLVQLYLLHVVHPETIFDLLRVLATRYEAQDVDLIALAVRQCGVQLRLDNPALLKDIILLIQTKQSPPDQASSHERHMLATVLDLKNNKRKTGDDERLKRLSELRKLVNATAGHKPQPIARVMWRELLEAELHGRWWIVGAAWAGRGNAARSDDSAAAPDAMSDHLTKLARKLGLTTELKRPIFYIIMTSTDVAHAFEALERLNMRTSQAREVPRILCLCCSAENVYNPFYALLGARLCAANRDTRASFQYAFWDVLKELQSLPVRRIANLARMLASLVAGATRSSLTLATFKVIDMSRLTARHCFFFDVFFRALFAVTSRSGTLPAVIELVAHEKYQVLRTGLLFFFTGFDWTRNDTESLGLEPIAQRDLDAAVADARRLLSTQNK